MTAYTSMESEEQERKLFVGGLNKVATDEDALRTFFIKYGGIIDCTIMRDADKQSRGFGFVLFDNSSSVDEIITSRKEGKAFSLDEHHIEVKRALPKVPGGTAGFSRTGGLFRKIFVGGLPSSITDEELRKYFERFGNVVETELLRDRETNRLRGFAFITFADEDSADKCIQRRTHEINKKICEVKRAQTRSHLNKFDDEDFNGGNRGGNNGGFRGGHRNDREDNRHHHHGPGGFSSGPPAPSTLGINEVNQLIQQAFSMGQQSVMNHTGNSDENSHRESKCRNSYGEINNKALPESVKASRKMRATSFQDKNVYKYARDRSNFEVDHDDQGIQAPTAASLLSQLHTSPFVPPAQNNPLLQALIHQQVAPAPAAAVAPIVPVPAAVPAAGNNALNQLAQLLQGRGIDPNALNALLKPEDTARGQPPAQKNAANGSYSTAYPATSSYDLYYNQAGTGAATSTNYGGSKEEADSKRYRPY